MSLDLWTMESREKMLLVGPMAPTAGYAHLQTAEASSDGSKTTCSATSSTSEEDDYYTGDPYKDMPTLEKMGAGYTNTGFADGKEEGVFLTLERYLFPHLKKSRRGTLPLDEIYVKAKKRIVKGLHSGIYEVHKEDIEFFKSFNSKGFNAVDMEDWERLRTVFSSKPDWFPALRSKRNRHRVQVKDLPIGTHLIKSLPRFRTRSGVEATTKSYISIVNLGERVLPFQESKSKRKLNCAQKPKYGDTGRPFQEITSMIEALKFGLNDNTVDPDFAEFENIAPTLTSVVSNPVKSCFENLDENMQVMFKGEAQNLNSGTSQQHFEYPVDQVAVVDGLTESESRLWNGLMAQLAKYYTPPGKPKKIPRRGSLDQGNKRQVSCQNGHKDKLSTKKTTGIPKIVTQEQPKTFITRSKTKAPVRARRSARIASSKDETHRVKRAIRKKSFQSSGDSEATESIEIEIISQKKALEISLNIPKEYVKLPTPHFLIEHGGKYIREEDIMLTLDPDITEELILRNLSVQSEVKAGPRGSCGVDYCQLGCICDSLQVRKIVRDHCGNYKCVLGCICCIKEDLCKSENGSKSIRSRLRPRDSMDWKGLNSGIPSAKLVNVKNQREDPPKKRQKRQDSSASTSRKPSRTNEFDYLMHHDGFEIEEVTTSEDESAESGSVETLSDHYTLASVLEDKDFEDSEAVLGHIQDMNKTKVCRTDREAILAGFQEEFAEDYGEEFVRVYGEEGLADYEEEYAAALRQEYGEAFREEFNRDIHELNELSESDDIYFNIDQDDGSGWEDDSDTLIDPEYPVPLTKKEEIQLKAHNCSDVEVKIVAFSEDESMKEIQAKSSCLMESSGNSQLILDPLDFELYPVQEGLSLIISNGKPLTFVSWSTLHERPSATRMSRTADISQTLLILPIPPVQCTYYLFGVPDAKKGDLVLHLGQQQIRVPIEIIQKTWEGIKNFKLAPDDDCEICSIELLLPNGKPVFQDCNVYHFSIVPNLLIVGPYAVLPTDDRQDATPQLPMTTPFTTTKFECVMNSDLQKLSVRLDNETDEKTKWNGTGDPIPEEYLRNILEDFMIQVDVGLPGPDQPVKDLSEPDGLVECLAEAKRRTEDLVATIRAREDLVATIRPTEDLVATIRPAEDLVATVRPIEKLVEANRPIEDIVEANRPIEDIVEANRPKEDICDAERMVERGAEGECPVEDLCELALPVEGRPESELPVEDCREPEQPAKDFHEPERMAEGSDTSRVMDKPGMSNQENKSDVENSKTLGVLEN